MSAALDAHATQPTDEVARAFTIERPPVAAIDLSMLTWIFGMATAFFGAFASSTAVMMMASGMELEGATLMTVVAGGLGTTFVLLAISANATGE